MRIIDIMFYMSAYLVGTAISHYNRDRIDTVIATAAYTVGLHSRSGHNNHTIDEHNLNNNIENAHDGSDRDLTDWIGSTMLYKVMHNHTGQNYFQNGQTHYQNGQTTSTYSTTSSLVNSITIAFGPWRHTPENKFLGGDLPAQPPRMTIATLRVADPEVDKGAKRRLRPRLAKDWWIHTSAVINNNNGPLRRTTRYVNELMTRSDFETDCVASSAGQNYYYRVDYGGSSTTPRTTATTHFISSSASPCSSFAPRVLGANLLHRLLQRRAALRAFLLSTTSRGWVSALLVGAIFTGPSTTGETQLRHPAQ